MIDTSGCSLYIGLLKASALATEYGTPLYVYDEDTIIARAKEILTSTEHFPMKILYSIKANPNPYILSLLYSMGFGFEASSPGEILLAAGIGASPSEILFTGSSVSIEDLKVAVELGVEINIDSIYAAKKLCRLNYAGSVGVRINPMFGAGYHEYTITGGSRAKFGVLAEELPNIVSKLKECGIGVKRLHAHLGSGITSPSLYIELLRFLTTLARKIRGVEEIDLGGGFAVPYKHSDKRFPWKVFSEKLREVLEELIADNYTLIIEPGRYLVAESGILLAEITDIKIRSGFLIVGTNTGINHLLRPALYGSYHEVLLVDKLCEKAVVTADIVGNLCESSDIIARNRKIPTPREGDIIAIMNTGAYGISMASNYNLRFLPAEVVVKSSGESILTRRRQSLEQLLESYKWTSKPLTRDT